MFNPYIAPSTKNSSAVQNQAVGFKPNYLNETLLVSTSNLSAEIPQQTSQQVNKYLEVVFKALNEYVINDLKYDNSSVTPFSILQDKIKAAKLLFREERNQAVNLYKNSQR